jgi:hypothetical protein
LESSGFIEKVFAKDSEESHVDLLLYKSISELKSNEFTRIFEIINKYIVIIEDKVSLGHQLVEFVENNL